MSPRSAPRLYKLSKDERRRDPPTEEERRLGVTLQRYSMLCRQGKPREADALLARQSYSDQTTLFSVCEEKRRKASSDTMLFGRTILASERKALENEERERGRRLTEKEIQAYLEQEKNRPRRRKNKGVQRNASQVLARGPEKVGLKQAKGDQGDQSREDAKTEQIDPSELQAWSDRTSSFSSSGGVEL